MAFSQTRNDIIKRASEIAGASFSAFVSDEIEEISAHLNIIINQWQQDGIRLTKLNWATQALSASTPTYTLSVGDRVLKAYVTRLGEDTRVELISYDEYSRIGDKDDEATDVRAIWIEYKTPPILYVFPIPNDANSTLRYLVQSNVTETETDVAVDFNTHEYQALIWSLAEHICYIKDTLKRLPGITNKANIFLKKLIAYHKPLDEDNHALGAYDMWDV